MKIKISRHYLYVLLLSMFLFIFVLVFSFSILIPKGKDYRGARLELKKENSELQKYQNFHDNMQKKLKDLQSEHRHIISAFRTTFYPKRFEKQHKALFSSLHISKVSRTKDDAGFATYEVNTTSQISSPANFYNFLDALNKSDWIIGVNFPIDFKRDGEMIKSSFTMKVYANNKDKNATASGSVSK